MNVCGVYVSLSSPTSLCVCVSVCVCVCVCVCVYACVRACGSVSKNACVQHPHMHTKELCGSCMNRPKGLLNIKNLHSCLLTHLVILVSHKPLGEYGELHFSRC